MLTSILYLINCQIPGLSKEDFIKFLNGVQFELDTKEKIVTIYFNGAFKGLGIVEDNIMKRFIVE